MGGMSDSSPEEEREGSVKTFLENSLKKLGIPTFAVGKYLKKFKDERIMSVSQLSELDNNDWRRLKLPKQIETGLRETLSPSSSPRPQPARSSMKLGGSSRPKPIVKKSKPKPMTILNSS